VCPPTKSCLESFGILVSRRLPGVSTTARRLFQSALPPLPVARECVRSPDCVFFLAIGREGTRVLRRGAVLLAALAVYCAGRACRALLCCAWLARARTCAVCFAVCCVYYVRRNKADSVVWCPAAPDQRRREEAAWGGPDRLVPQPFYLIARPLGSSHRPRRRLPSSNCHLLHPCLLRGAPDWRFKDGGLFISLTFIITKM